MPATNDPQLTVWLESQERELTNISSYSIDSSYLTSTDGFEFTTFDTDRNKLRTLDMQKVELLLNYNSQLLGRIDATEIGGNGSEVTCRGRDYIADLVECNVDPILILKNNMTLFGAILIAASPVGIDTVVGADDIVMSNVRSGVKSRSKKGKSKKELKVSDLKPNPGEGIYEFLNRLIARHGVTIQPGPDRHTLVLSEPNYSQEPLYSIRRTDDSGASVTNNIVNATVTRDYSSFPTYALFSGKETNPGTIAKDASKKFDIVAVARDIGGELQGTIVSNSFEGRRIPPAVINKGGEKLYRLLYLRDEQSKTSEEVLHAVTRGVGERLKDTLQYSVTLRGHQDPATGALWAIDTVVQVDDDILGIHEPLWISERRFEFNSSSGATTSLKCWRLGVFQL